MTSRPDIGQKRGASSGGTSMPHAGVGRPHGPVVVGHPDGREIHRGRADEAGDEAVGGRVVELERLAHLLHHAVLHHHHAVAQRHRLDLVVGHVDRGGAEPVVQSS